MQRAMLPRTMILLCRQQQNHDLRLMAASINLQQSSSIPAHIQQETVRQDWASRPAHPLSKTRYPRIAELVR